MESTRNISLHKSTTQEDASNHVTVMKKQAESVRQQRLYFVYPLEFAFILLCLSLALSHLLVSHSFTPFSGPTSATPLARAFPHPSLFGFFLSTCIFKRQGPRARWIEMLGSVLVVFCIFNLLYQRLVLGGRVRKHKDNAYTIKRGLPR